MNPSPSVQSVCILGVTGSIGSSTLSVIEHNPQRYRVACVTAGKNVPRMHEICLRHHPDLAVMADPDSARELDRALRATGSRCEVRGGAAALTEAAADGRTGTVVAGIVGAAGLAATWAAVTAGKRVLLANKEALVMAGRLFMQQVARSGARLLPIDSEHNAILQALPAHFDGRAAPLGVRRIILTASGGPFRKTALADLAAVTPAQACAHPNWKMGRKISVDSATLLNKGLEVIEARWLFDVSARDIEVVVHPQSIIHSMVEYRDGSVLAQLSHPDMRIPIAHALAYPERIESGAGYLDLARLRTLEFEPPDLTRFPCLRLAFAALADGGRAPIVLNAANEVAVAAFLDGRIGFTAIPAVIEATLDRADTPEPNDLAAVMETDRHAREEAMRQVEAARRAA